MKKPTPEEARKALDSLCPVEECPALTVLDRSTLERWACCPFQAASVASGRVCTSNLLTASGQEAHDALSRATREWIDSAGGLSPVELRNTLETELRCSRPDVQPDTLTAAQYSAWSWSRFLSAIHPANILRFDGGEEVNRSGQLSMDFEGLGVRVTSELDLLYSGPSIDLLHEVDYKTGHKIHTAADVAASFQFGLHALLIFATYPNVQAVEVTVWNTRSNQRTYRVIFDRRREPDLRMRVKMALGTWYQHRNDPTPPTWPAIEKCSICDAAALCPVAGEPVRELAADPVGVLNQLVAVDAKRDALASMLAARVDTLGHDIQGQGVAFGRHKPPTTRRKPAELYETEG